MKLGPLAILLVACGAPAPAPSLPWVTGLATTAASDVETSADGDGYGALSIATSSGTIVASYQQGVAVVDRRDHVIARAPGFEIEGSADDLVALAAGDAQLDKPVIVLAVVSGGHRESTTSLVVYQLGEHGRLDRLFDAPIEERDGDQTASGALTFVPHGLLYRSPNGPLERWSFDASRRRYVRDAAP